MPLIDSGFPGVGKSHVATTQGRVSDSDTSHFSWAPGEERVRHPEWPHNYIAHIKALTQRAEITLPRDVGHVPRRDALRHGQGVAT